jgi:hypothetical protein
MSHRAKQRHDGAGFESRRRGNRSACRPNRRGPFSAVSHARANLAGPFARLCDLARPFNARRLSGGAAAERRLGQVTGQLGQELDGLRRPQRFTGSCDGARWRGGELHSDAEPSSGPGVEGEGSVVCFGDALDDCQTEADASVVGAYT